MSKSSPGRERYSRYISSSEWQAKRRRALRRQHRQCRACGSMDKLHVHHATYERFTREADADLVVLCESCHSLVHRFHVLSGLTLPDATERFLVRNTLRKVSPKRRRELIEANHAPRGWKPANTRGLKPGEHTADWRIERRTLNSIVGKK